MEYFLCLILAGMKAGDVGLALSYAVTLMGMFQWGVRQSAEVENMVRTLKYLSHDLQIILICRFYAQETFIVEKKNIYLK